MSSSCSPRDVDSADYAADPPPRNKDALTFAPDSVQLIQELLVVIDISQLPVLAGAVLLEVEVRRTRDHQVD